MEVFMLSITIFISFLLETSLSMKCSESVPTMSIVSRCPSNATEWDIAAKRKSCNALARIQNCTHAKNFVYHCVLNEEATMLVEVCAPIYFLTGYCSRYSEVDGKFINKPDLDCTVFDPPCPKRFQSNESYKYQKCYEKVIKQPQEKNREIQYVPLVIVLVIALTLLILLAVGFKLRWIKCICGKKHGQKTEENSIGIQVFPEIDYGLLQENSIGIQVSPEIDYGLLQENSIGIQVSPEIDYGLLQENSIGIQVSPEKDDDLLQGTGKVIECKNLTGSTKVTCFLQASSAILDLRNTLSKKLDIPNTLILVVDKENGIIFQDDIEIETLKQSPIEFILGNRNRTRIIDDDGSVENDVISNKNITYGKCKMSCGHFTDPETLFDWTKDKLPGVLDSGLLCPRCPTMFWGINELVEKCNMSADENMFFKKVADLSKLTGDKVGYERPKPTRSVSKIY